MVDHFSQPAWLDVESFRCKTLVKAGSALTRAVEFATRAGMPPTATANSKGWDGFAVAVVQ